jgi:nicotinic acid mononucleotide adenylyltransferase
MLFSCCADGTLVVNNFGQQKRMVRGDLSLEWIDRRLAIVLTDGDGGIGADAAGVVDSGNSSRLPYRRVLHVRVICGSLSPPHRGHSQLLEEARRWVETELGGEVAFAIVSPYHDDYGTLGLIPSDRRIEMCELSALNCDWVTVSRWDASQEVAPSEAQTINHISDVLSSRYADAGVEFRLVFVVGSTERQPRIDVDAYYTEILSVADLLFLSCHKHVTQLDDMPVVDNHRVWLHQSQQLLENVHAKVVRSNIFLEKDVSELLEPNVAEYLIKQRLYM